MGMEDALLISKSFLCFFLLIYLTIINYYKRIIAQELFDSFLEGTLTLQVMDPNSGQYYNFNVRFAFDFKN